MLPIGVMCGRANLRALVGEGAIAAVAAQFPRDGARRAPKGPSNLSSGLFLKIEVGESHAIFGLNLFAVLG